MAVTISAPVGMGPKAANRLVDVRTIQHLLNGIKPSEGGPQPLLVVDGLCGKKTESAVQQFQLKHFGWKLADGRVDPGGQTLALMNQLSGSSPGPPEHDDAAVRCHPAPGVTAAVSGSFSGGSMHHLAAAPGGGRSSGDFAACQRAPSKAGCPCVDHIRLGQADPHAFDPVPLTDHRQRGRSETL